MENDIVQTRPEQILAKYISFIDQHLDDLVKHKVDRMFEIEDFADALHIHPTHFSNVIKATTGKSPCGIYQPRILSIAYNLLTDASYSVRDVAFILTFEPSQFTKWFKRLTGITPKQYRLQQMLKS